MRAPNGVNSSEGAIGPSLTRRGTRRGRSGPKSPDGKARVAVNATSHGIFSRALVLPNVERLEDWEKHIHGVLDSLAPVGHVEILLARRVADAFWRLERFRRYEAAVLRDRVLHSQSELDDLTQEIVRQRGGQKTDWEPSPLAARWSLVRECVEVLERCATMSADTPINFYTARRALGALADEAQIHLKDVPIPDLPLDEGQVEVEPVWTAGHFRAALGLIATQVKRASDALIAGAIVRARAVDHEIQKKYEWLMREREAVEALHLLPETETLQQLTRYEAHLTRQLNHALHQMAILQARRRGERVHLGSIWHGGVMKDPLPVSGSVETMATGQDLGEYS